MTPILVNSTQMQQYLTNDTSLKAANMANSIYEVQIVNGTLTDLSTDDQLTEHKITTVQYWTSPYDYGIDYAEAVSLGRTIYTVRYNPTTNASNEIIRVVGQWLIFNDWQAITREQAEQEIDNGQYVKMQFRDNRASKSFGSGGCHRYSLDDEATWIETALIVPSNKLLYDKIKLSTAYRVFTDGFHETGATYFKAI